MKNICFVEDFRANVFNLLSIAQFVAESYSCMYFRNPAETFFIKRLTYIFLRFE